MSSKIKSFLSIVLLVWLFAACSNASETADLNQSTSDETTIEPDGDVPQETSVEEVTEDETAIIQEDATAELTEAVYTIVPEESTARFELDENLRSALTGWHRGSRITVVGTTDQLFGEITLDPSNLSTIQFDDLRINAYTLDTDDYYRTRMIQRRILESEVYEFITFSPTDVVDLPETAGIGESVSFSLEGDLTIRDITLPQTFQATAVLSSPTEIKGFVSAVVLRDSYELVIPGVPHVSDIEEEVELYIDFVARTP